MIAYLHKELWHLQTIVAITCIEYGFESREIFSGVLANTIEDNCWTQLFICKLNTRGVFSKEVPVYSYW